MPTITPTNVLGIEYVIVLGRIVFVCDSETYMENCLGIIFLEKLISVTQTNVVGNNFAIISGWSVVLFHLLVGTLAMALPSQGRRLSSEISVEALQRQSDESKSSSVLRKKRLLRPWQRERAF